MDPNSNSIGYIGDSKRDSCSDSNDNDNDCDINNLNISSDIVINYLWC